MERAVPILPADDLVVAIEAVNQLYGELMARGAIVTSQPTEKPWGLREFTLQTPDGHRIACGESIARR